MKIEVVVSPCVMVTFTRLSWFWMTPVSSRRRWPNLQVLVFFLITPVMLFI